MIVPDTTGAAPGSSGLKERLAFLFRPAKIELKELASDITYDRSNIVLGIQRDIKLWMKFFKDFDETNKTLVASGKKKKTLSSFAHPAFTTFIRSPHCASFRIKGKNGAKEIEFLAINAHTLYGKSKTERNREFFALLEWLVQRAKSPKRMYYKNIVLLADLNMEFDNSEIRLSEIIKRLIELESTLLKGKDAARVNFPFLDVHPEKKSLFYTNARKNQTFDHIALFIAKNEKHLPKSFENQKAGTGGSNAYDYGVFDFTELFSQATHNSTFESLTKTEQ